MAALERGRDVVRVQVLAHGLGLGGGGQQAWRRWCEEAHQRRLLHRVARGGVATQDGRVGSREAEKTRSAVRGALMEYMQTGHIKAGSLGQVVLKVRIALATASGVASDAPQAIASWARELPTHRAIPPPLCNALPNSFRPHSLCKPSLQEHDPFFRVPLTSTASCSMLAGAYAGSSTEAPELKSEPRDWVCTGEGNGSSKQHVTWINERNASSMSSGNSTAGCGGGQLPSLFRVFPIHVHSSVLTWPSPGHAPAEFSQTLNATYASYMTTRHAGMYP